MAIERIDGGGIVGDGRIVKLFFRQLGTGERGFEFDHAGGSGRMIHHAGEAECVGDVLAIGRTKACRGWRLVDVVIAAGHPEPGG